MLQRVFIVLLILLILPDVYLFFRYIIPKIKNKWWRAIYWLPTLLLTVGLLYLVYFGDQTLVVEHARIVGWFAIFFFVVVAPKLVLALFALLGTPFHKWLHWPRTPFTAVGVALATLIAFVVLYGSFIGRTRLEIKQATYTSPRLPQGFDGYRIVVLSDIHIGSWVGNEQFVQRMVDVANEQHPDLIVFTGDLVNHRAIELNGFEQILAGLKAKDGVYSILGNHDYGTYFHWPNKQAEADNLKDLERREADMGWKLLNNDHAILRHTGDSIALIGVENDGEPPFSQHADLPQAVQGTEGMFRILLSHNPTHWRREVLPKSDIDLMLAGHTHAMQLEIGSYSPSKYVYPEWGGFYYKGERALYVNVGIGYIGLPFRFGAWPEITVLTLNKKR
ncbi:MAG: metallophosphoesterase [Mediterranea sp.]|jgi:predicted MPP superfamily phosphohydrolase|nr:metallophosphoesterase [Mediterranea sp.]